MADISQVQVGSTTYDVHDAIARTDVSNEIARAKKAESDEYTRATTAEAALRDSVSKISSDISTPTTYKLKVSSENNLRVSRNYATVFTLDDKLKIILFDVEIGWLQSITSDEYVFTAPMPFKVKKVLTSVSTCNSWRVDRARIALTENLSSVIFVALADKPSPADGTNADNGYYIPFYGIMVVQV